MRTRKRVRRTKQRRRVRVRKTRVRKTRGGFFTGASYLFDQGTAIFQVPAPTPYGNPSLPVNPFPYSQS